MITRTAALTEAITLAESGDLVRLEIVIKRGLETFFEVGEALAEIRNRRLYRIEHTTFEDYCKTKWRMSDRRARQLIGASEVVTDISKSGTMVPKSERQVRPLTALPKEQRAEAWKGAVEASATGTPTAKEVEAVVETMKPKKAKSPRIERDGILHARFSLDSNGKIEVLEVLRADKSSTAKCVVAMDALSVWEIGEGLRRLLHSRAASGIMKAIKAAEAAR